MSRSEAEFAWPGGDRPGRLDFAHHPPEAVRAAVRGVLAAAFPFALDPHGSFTSLVPGSGPAGRYRLTTREGSWFVRVSSRWGHPELESTLAHFLLSEGVNVSSMIVAGVPLRWHDDTYRVDAHPLINGRHFDGSLADLQAVGALVSHCHTALHRFPRREEIRAAAASRNSRLVDTRERLAKSLNSGLFDEFHEHAQWASAHRQWLEEMVDGLDPRTERLPDAQCLHGELHQGNVMFGAEDGAPVLVDLEEAVHVFGPPAWDLAFLIQRFCLADSPSRAELKEQLARVAASYGLPLQDLAPMMRQIAWFNMAVILDLRHTHGVVTPLAEYDKFVAMERQAVGYQDAL